MESLSGQPAPSPAGGLPDPPLHPSTVQRRGSALGAHLRAWREAVSPAQAGLHASAARRVPGLRREELAQLAGISVDYYLRLERGRAHNPSAQVLDAIARALDLDADQRAHLRALTSAPRPASPATQSTAEVPATALALLAALEQPAFIENAHMNILASNDAARALNPRLTAGRNQLPDLFLDADERAMHPDWEAVARCLTASLRFTVGGNQDDPTLVAMTSDLEGRSDDFRRLWALHEVRAQRGATVRIAHRDGDVATFHREQMGLHGPDRLKMVVYARTPEAKPS